jgi:hypothetical protein
MPGEHVSAMMTVERLIGQAETWCFAWAGKVAFLFVYS